MGPVLSLTEFSKILEITDKDYLLVYDSNKVSEKSNQDRALEAPCLSWTQRTGNKDEG